VILISAHLGNWEMSAQFVSGLVKSSFVAVARKIRFKPFERWVNGLRTRFGGELIDKKGAMPAMRSALSQGKVLGILIDQGGEGATAKFFGHDVQAHAAVALLALRSRCPVIPAFCVREANGFRIILDSPLHLKRTSDLRADIQTNIQLMMDAVEKAIRAYPDQWFWFHKRWKAFYPQLYREDVKKAKRREERRRKKVLSMQQ
jgi:KDO2-lipid IV(A) lauroyltransferase